MRLWGCEEGRREVGQHAITSAHSSSVHFDDTSGP